MKKQTAMSLTAGECWLQPLSDSELDEWLIFNDDIKSEKEIGHPSLKQIKAEIGEEILHGVEDLECQENDYLLGDFPLFEEIQSLTPYEECKTQMGQIPPDLDWKLNQVQTSRHPNPVISEVAKCSSTMQELLTSSYENSIIFSEENVLRFDAEPCVNVTSLHPESLRLVKPGDNEMEKLVEGRSTLNFDSDTVLSLATSPDVKKELAVVDEIIRSTAMELDQWESDTSRSEISSDGFIAPESAQSSTLESESDDPEWKPKTLKSSNRKNHVRSWKPYTGGQEDRRLRKKEQNKNAATRYRLKKKAEVSEILKEEEELRQKKAKLEEKVFDMQNEIKYLKGLLRDLFKAKGLI